ncbi:hypothetical protein IEE91_11475 [Kocuria sp. cx-455]|uniref:ferritin family protein n=1 Tax=unclassified Candidatus Sulfotelmatobacter TaxID=2635724 RepID=UPI00168969D6|nr:MULTISPECIES: hypothetical protein [unclassified Candidatus Sulfotelmatobacter]MBD2763224.1 hypothetical protein [Kocuria sp. cx-116]MBD2765796.1 hypothetical protein [Kocuria sp. cx-455]
MGFDQYHEPAEELSDETRTLVRMLTNLTEEAEAIDWYEQRMSVEKDQDALAIMANSLGEEYKHFSMELEFLLRKKPEWRAIARGILFKDGDIVDNGETSEEAATEGGGDSGAGSADPAGSLGIGSLKGAAS